MCIYRSDLYFNLNIAISLNPWIIRTRTITQGNFKRSIFVARFITSVINIIALFQANKNKTKKQS